jgi:hypothetical protein
VVTLGRDDNEDKCIDASCPFPVLGGQMGVRDGTGAKADVADEEEARKAVESDQLHAVGLLEFWYTGTHTIDHHKLVSL